jgi:hypothetical protein
MGVFLAPLMRRAVPARASEGYRSLRRFFAWVARGERLGDASIPIILDAYRRVLPSLHEEAARDLDAWLAGRGAAESYALEADGLLSCRASIRTTLRWP